MFSEGLPGLYHIHFPLQKKVFSPEKKDTRWHISTVLDFFSKCVNVQLGSLGIAKND